VLSEWMCASSEARLLVLHAGGDACFKGARGAVRKLWKSFGRSWVSVHPAHLCKCEWPDLRHRYKIGG
jgi:hypothetical protein